MPRKRCHCNTSCCNCELRHRTCTMSSRTLFVTPPITGGGSTGPTGPLGPQGVQGSIGPTGDQGI